MPDELDGLRSRLESSVDVPPFERIVERAEDTRHRRRATRSAMTVGLAAAAIIAAVFIVAKLPGQEQGPPSVAESPAAEPDSPKIAAAVTEPGTIYEWSGDEPMRARVPLKDVNVRKEDRLTLRMTVDDELHGETAQYDATMAKAPSGAWTVVTDPKAGSGCSGLTLTVSGAVAQYSVPASCRLQRTMRLRWKVTASSDGRAMMEPFEFVTLRPSGGGFVEPELSTDDPTLKSPVNR